MSMQSLLRLLTLMSLHLEPQVAAELATSIQLKAQNLGTISIPPTIAKGGAVQGLIMFALPLDVTLQMSHH